jgi:hypothetical protein
LASRVSAFAFFQSLWRIFASQKPGFPLQFLEIAHAISAGFPLQSRLHGRAATRRVATSPLRGLRASSDFAKQNRDQPLGPTGWLFAALTAHSHNPAGIRNFKITSLVKAGLAPANLRE